VPTKLQRELFEDASAIVDGQQIAPLRETLARFLHDHKNVPSHDHRCAKAAQDIVPIGRRLRVAVTLRLARPDSRAFWATLDRLVAIGRHPFLTALTRPVNMPNWLGQIEILSSD